MRVPAPRLFSRPCLVGGVQPLCDRSPAEIRAALPAARRCEFDVEFLAALADAGRTFRLDEVSRVVADWYRAVHGEPAAPA